MEEKDVNEPLDKNQSELEKEFEEELRSENIEIIDLASYVANVKGVSTQTKQDMANLMGLLKEAPKVGATVAARKGKEFANEIGAQAKTIKKQFVAGVKSVKSNIEKEVKSAKESFKEYKENVKNDFDEIDDVELATDMSLHKTASRENRDIEDWAEGKKNEGKFSDKVVETVRDVKSNSKENKTKIASGAIKVAGFFGKGLALFGKTGLAKEMLDKLGQYGESFVARDSRVAQIMEKGAEKGFIIVDAIREAKENFGYFRDGVKEDATEIDGSQLASDISVHKVASQGKRKIEEWANDKKEEGRSDAVINSVQNVQKASKNIRTKVASGAVKVAGFFGKGLALFGKKDLAKEMVENVGERAGKFVEKDSRLGNIMQRGAESGFVVVDSVKQFGRDAKAFGKDAVETAAIYGMMAGDKIKDVAETAAIYGMMAGDKIKDVAETAAIHGMLAGDKVKETAKDGAILLGKATYAPIGIGLGISEYAIEAVNNKIVQPGIGLANDVKENVIDPGIVKVTQKAGQTKQFGSKLWDLAKAKISQVKNMPTNLRGRAEGLLKSAADKIAPSLEDRAVAENRTAIAAQKGQDAREAFNTLTGKETKQNSDDMEK